MQCSPKTGPGAQAWCPVPKAESARPAGRRVGSSKAAYAHWSPGELQRGLNARVGRLGGRVGELQSGLRVCVVRLGKRVGEHRSCVRVRVGRSGRRVGELQSGLRGGVGRLDASKIWDPRSGTHRTHRRERAPESPTGVCDRLGTRVGELQCGLWVCRPLGAAGGCAPERPTGVCVGRPDAPKIWDPRSGTHRTHRNQYLRFRVMIYL